LILGISVFAIILYAPLVFNNMIYFKNSQALKALIIHL